MTTTYRRLLADVRNGMLTPSQITELTTALAAATVATGSRRAAIAHHFTAAHLRVLVALGQGACTDTQLIRRYNIRATRSVAPWPLLSDAGIRSRRAELVRWGFAVPTGDYGRSRSGRRTQVWDVSTTAHLGYVPDGHDDSVAPALAAFRLEADTDLVAGAVVADVARALVIR